MAFCQTGTNYQPDMISICCHFMKWDLFALRRDDQACRSSARHPMSLTLVRFFYYANWWGSNYVLQKIKTKNFIFRELSFHLLKCKFFPDVKMPFLFHTMSLNDLRMQPLGKQFYLPSSKTELWQELQGSAPRRDHLRDEGLMEGNPCLSRLFKTT